jgi:uncharacterized protein YndB with AHSA1/START domain
MGDSPSSGEGATVTLRRRLAAPVAVVYAMLVDPAELRQWLGPHDFVVTDLQADVRVGGVFRFRMRHAAGGDYGADGVYREVVLNQRIVLTWRWNEAPAGEPLDRAESLVTFAVSVEGNGTLLTLTHSRLPDDASADSHGTGWNDALDKLSTQLNKMTNDETTT